MFGHTVERARDVALQGFVALEDEAEAMVNVVVSKFEKSVS